MAYELYFNKSVRNNKLASGGDLPEAKPQGGKVNRSVFFFFGNKKVWLVEMEHTGRQEVSFPSFSNLSFHEKERTGGDRMNRKF